jgi:prepilin-type N-terminal cleavage/methylation domain-containing protein
MPSNRAFTLLELLVVITIIGILASIVVVSMSGSTDSATIAKGKAYAQQVHALLGHEAVLDLNFNEGNYNTCSDGADVCDASGYGNNGTIYNNEATFVSSPIDGYALNFDGVNEYVECGNNNALVTLTSEKTFEFWINPKTGFTYAGFLGLDNNSSNNRWYVDDNNGSGRIRIYGMINGIEETLLTTASNTLTYENWQHIVVIDNGLIWKIFINGILINSGSESLDFSLLPVDSTFKLGKVRHSSAYHFLGGYIDDVRIYAVALPSTEIQKHYVQGLEKLLVNQNITQAEYDQRMEEFNQSLASNRF